MLDYIRTLMIVFASCSLVRSFCLLDYGLGIVWPQEMTFQTVLNVLYLRDQRDARDANSQKFALKRTKAKEDVRFASRDIDH